LSGPSPRIAGNRQGKHIVGHNGYIPGRSILTADPNHLGRYAGTGHSANGIAPGVPGARERVNFGQTIGKYVDESGIASDTTNGIIHYSKDGIHIVPARP